MVRDLAQRWRHPTFILEYGDELQDFALSWGQ
jgi:hypothetical protein